MDVEEIDMLGTIMVDGEWVQREVKEIFEMRPDRGLDLSVSRIKVK